jgi:hypothetical protein
VPVGVSGVAIIGWQCVQWRVGGLDAGVSGSTLGADADADLELPARSAVRAARAAVLGPALAGLCALRDINLPFAVPVTLTCVRCCRTWHRSRS